MRMKLRLPIRASVIFALSAIILAIMGLIGYIPGFNVLACISRDYIPMAPSTAVSFLILGGVMLLMEKKDFSIFERYILVAIVSFITMFSLLNVIGSLCGADLNFERSIMPHIGHLNQIPIGLMSPATGTGFLISGMSVLIILLRHNSKASFPFLEHIAGLLGYTAWIIGLVFSLAYFYGTPLLYGYGSTIPMALTTALGFILLPVSIMLNSGKYEFPMKFFNMDKTHGYLFCYLLPLSALSVILGGLAVFRVYHFSAINPALVTAFLIVTATILAGFFALTISRHLGHRIDRVSDKLKLTTDVLSTSEENLRITLNSIGDAVIATDLEARITRMNPVAESLTGWQLKDAMGKPLLDIFNIINAKTRQPAVDPVEKVINTGKIVGLANHTKLIAKNGIEYHIADSASPILDERGSLSGVVLVFRDVSEEYELIQAMRASEIRFETIFRQSPAGMALVDSDSGYILEMNQKFVEICGRTRQELANDNWFSATHPNEVRREKAKLSELNSGKIRVFTMNKRYVKPDKSIAWLEMTITMINFEEETTPRLLCMINDLTESKLIQLENKSLAKFPDENPNPVIRATSDGRLLYSNRSGQPLLTLWDVRVDDFLPEPWLERVKRVLEQDYLREFEVECFGSHYSLVLNPIREMGYVNIYGFDISERKLAENRLSHALANAEAANITKSEFLATISHEIRTPLNGILGFAAILKDSLPINILNEVKEDFEIIEKSGSVLLDIINDVLELSSIEAGQFNKSIEEFSPTDLIKDSLEVFYFKSQEKKIQLKFVPQDLPNILSGDCRRLKQILFNIIGNAVKFTEEGQVEVIAEYNENKLYLTVADTGCGITQDKLGKILEPFYQADQSSTRKNGGSGLGLTIVSKMLDKLGGSLKIESSLNKGTSVKVAFPAIVPMSVKPIALPAQVQSENSLTEINILIVEDDPASTMYLNRILKGAGAETQIADSFDTMKKICSDAGFIPDVALLDISLSGNDGFDCLDWLRENLPNQGIKYIAQTAHVMLDRVCEYKQAGFHDFIGKPYSRNELIKIVYKHVSNHSK